ncbi:hypothetical protein [Saccharibacillus alkalitolerans]|uniref:Uncharacterized protein n=1 Tax=Saccharibacillus alkalitolerans TaxID=2705290 RepID=A0ABX0F478_9BACL|nr:hypothetical protein [Saccharibacillus alkalitolerans]NGZ75178.1 hypothetical protein [Saccharibacillus alkalitolerans]
MNLFRISPVVQGKNRMEDFLRDCFVSIGYPGIGNLEEADGTEVSKRLNRVYGYEGSELERRAEEVVLFVRGMKDGDYVLVPCGGSVWLGDLGDYYYREDYDNPDEATCHRRGVTWLGVLPAASLNPLLREFAAAPEAEGTAAAASRFPLPAELAGLEAFAAQAPGGRLPGIQSAATSEANAYKAGQLEQQAVPSPAAGFAASVIDEETLREAVAVLREALRGGDPQLRVRAAEALLRYAR